MVNLTALTDLTPLTFNTTNMSNAETLIPNIINTTDSVSQGYFGLVVMVGVFIMLLYTTFRQDGDITLDIIRSIMLSSGFTGIIGVIMLVTGLSSSFVHVMWFLTIFIITIMVLFIKKRKGL